MVYYALALTAITLVAGAFSLAGARDTSTPVAQILFAIFFVVAMLSLFVGLIRK